MNTTKSNINLWANFLYNEKLDPIKFSQDKINQLIELSRTLANKSKPYRRPYYKRQESRKLICTTAIELNIDITSFKYKGKISIGRGLLDIWYKVYKEKFGSVIGTDVNREIKRRDIKIKLKRANWK